MAEINLEPVSRSAQAPGECSQRGVFRPIPRLPLPPPIPSTLPGGGASAAATKCGHRSGQPSKDRYQQPPMLTISEFS